MNKDVLKLEKEIVANCNVMDKKILKKNLDSLLCLKIQNDLEIEEKVWVFWQIQDHYGLLRDSENLKNEFVEFCQYVNTVGGGYSFMPICDSTQRLTLLLGNHYSIWYEQFNYALKNINLSKSNMRIMFETLRTSIGIFTDERVLTKREDLIKSFKLFDEFLLNNNDLSNYNYYLANYYALRIKAQKYIYFNLIEEFCWIEDLVLRLDRLIGNETDNNYVFGSIEDWSLEQDTGYTSKTGITNILFSLCEQHEVELSIKLLRQLKIYRITNNRLKRMLNIV